VQFSAQSLERPVQPCIKPLQVVKVLGEELSVEARRLGYSPDAQQQLVDGHFEIVLVEVGFCPVDFDEGVAPVGRNGVTCGILTTW